MANLAEQHLEALAWFEKRTGAETGWPEPLPSGQLLAAKAKGIYRPKGWSHALSIRVIPGGDYPDEKPSQLGGGKWRFRYHQEERKNGGDASGFATNQGLRLCMAEHVPIGVLWQSKPSPNPRYEVLGLGHVSSWQDGFFMIEGPTTVAPPIVALATGEPAEPVSTEDARERVLKSIAQRRGQAAFRAKLLNAYERTCAISECRLEAVLEAAHIVPYRGDQTNVVTNGLLLRSDLHTLFDLNLIRIDQVTLAVLVDDALRGSEYEQYSGRPLRVPKEAQERPTPANFQVRNTLLGND